MRLFAGQSAWVAQRLTALLALVLLVAAAVALLTRATGFESWRAPAGSAHGAVLIVIGFVALGVHGWIGARDVVLDYVHSPAWRLALLTVAAILLTGVLVRVLLTLAFAFGSGT
jgi:succinate dehydrogenase / fumarate reductase membrane anchor subunit